MEIAEQAEPIGEPTPSAALSVLLLMVFVKLPVALTFVMTLSASVGFSLKLWD
jgi:hypothetical protein